MPKAPAADGFFCCDRVLCHSHVASKCARGGLVGSPQLCATPAAAACGRERLARCWHHVVPCGGCVLLCSVPFLTLRSDAVLLSSTHLAVRPVDITSSQGQWLPAARSGYDRHNHPGRLYLQEPPEHQSLLSHTYRRLAWYVVLACGSASICSSAAIDSLGLAWRNVAAVKG